MGSEAANQQILGQNKNKRRESAKKLLLIHRMFAVEGSFLL